MHLRSRKRSQQLPPQETGAQPPKLSAKPNLATKPKAKTNKKKAGTSLNDAKADQEDDDDQQDNDDDDGEDHKDDEEDEDEEEEEEEEEESEEEDAENEEEENDSDEDSSSAYEDNEDEDEDDEDDNEEQDNATEEDDDQENEDEEPVVKSKQKVSNSGKKIAKQIAGKQITNNKEKESKKKKAVTGKKQNGKILRNKKVAGTATPTTTTTTTNDVEEVMSNNNNNTTISYHIWEWDNEGKNYYPTGRTINRQDETRAAKYIARQGVKSFVLLDFSNGEGIRHKLLHSNTNDLQNKTTNDEQDFEPLAHQVLKDVIVSFHLASSVPVQIPVTIRGTKFIKQKEIAVRCWLRQRVAPTKILSLLARYRFPARPVPVALSGGGQVGGAAENVPGTKGFTGSAAAGGSTTTGSPLVGSGPAPTESTTKPKSKTQKPLPPLLGGFGPLGSSAFSFNQSRQLLTTPKQQEPPLPSTNIDAMQSRAMTNPKIAKLSDVPKPKQTSKPRVGGKKSKKTQSNKTHSNKIGRPNGDNAKKNVANKHEKMSKKRKSVTNNTQASTGDTQTINTFVGKPLKPKKAVPPPIPRPLSLQVPKERGQHW